MIKLFLDIETIPTEEEKKDVFVEILAKKNAKKGKDATPEELFLTTSLEGTFGRICCIGYIKENNSNVEKGVLKGTEKEILVKFWEIAKDVDQFIGHNIYDFDLPFIYKRSYINGVKPRMDISFARYRNYPIFDTMKEWELWSFSYGQKLDTLAKALDLPTSKDEMDGSEVWQYFQDGKLDDICKYCMKDVELTRKIYYKMIFENPDGNSSSKQQDIDF